MVLDSREVDYNLFQSHFELKDVVLQGEGLSDLPAPFRAQRVTVDISIGDLFRRSFDGARIRIDGLSVHLVRAANGPP